MAGLEQRDKVLPVDGAALIPVGLSHRRAGHTRVSALPPEAVAEQLNVACRQFKDVIPLLLLLHVDLPGVSGDAEEQRQIIV